MAAGKGRVGEEESGREVGLGWKVDVCEEVVV